MTSTTNTHDRNTLEQRIAKMARASAKIILALRAEGDPDGAKRFEAAAITVADQMRATRGVR